MNNTREKAATNAGKINDTNFSLKNGKVHIFPFIIRNGYVNVTEKGFVPKGENPYFYSFFQKVFTGRETITATWEDSTQLNVRDASLGTYNYDFQVGKYYEGMIVPGSLTQNIDIEDVNGNEGFLAMQESSEITIAFSRNELDESPVDFIPTEDDLFKLYIIPETKLRNKWLYISNVTTYVNPKNSANILTEVTFTSLKDKLEQSGRALEQYVQYAAPGEPYAFPFITSENEVILSPYRLSEYSFTPVKYLQVELQGANAFSSVTVFGRKLYWDDTNKKWYTSPSKFLLPYRFVVPQANVLNKTAAPTKNFFVFPDETIETRSTDEWLTAIKKQGTDLAPVKNMGSFTMSGEWQKLDNNYGHISNRINNTTILNYKDYNDASWKPLENYLKNNDTPTTYRTITVPTNGNVYSGDNVVYTHNDNLIQILIKNSMCNIVQLELPLDMKQTRPYRWSSIPIIGFWTRWFGDRAITQNTINVKTNHICYLIDTNLAFLSYNAFQQPSAPTSAYGNLQIFNGEDAPSMLNPSSANTTICFRLTDKVSFTDAKYVDPNNRRPLANGIDTVYLSQKKDEYGDNLHNDGTALLLNCADNSLDTKYTNDGFIIDEVVVNALHIGKIKISCYSDKDESGYGACDVPIFTQTVLSNSMFEQHNIRNWTTFLTLGCWDSNWSNGKITWPLAPEKDLKPYLTINAIGSNIVNKVIGRNVLDRYPSFNLPNISSDKKQVWYENTIKEETIPYRSLPGEYTSAQDIINNVDTLLFSVGKSIFELQDLGKSDLTNKYINVNIIDFDPQHKIHKVQALGSLNSTNYSPISLFQNNNARYLIVDELIHKTDRLNCELQQIVILDVELRDDGFYYKIAEKILLSGIGTISVNEASRVYLGDTDTQKILQNNKLNINIDKIVFVNKQTN